MSPLKRNFLFLTVMLQKNILATEKSTDVILLQPNHFEHIEFKKTKANHLLFINQQLQINVNDSASFLMQAFDHIKSVKRVSFEWRSDTLPKIKNAQHEKQKLGDDAVFKLGLLLKTDESISNPWIPKWMQRVNTLLNFPSEEMIYLVANAKHTIGERWENPYNKRVTMISIESIDNKKDWHLARYEFNVPVNVVAIWLMADGDNTHSHFTVHIQNIKIE